VGVSLEHGRGLRMLDDMFVWYGDMGGRLLGTKMRMGAYRWGRPGEWNELGDQGTSLVGPKESRQRKVDRGK